MSTDKARSAEAYCDSNRELEDPRMLQPLSWVIKGAERQVRSARRRPNAIGNFL